MRRIKEFRILSVVFVGPCSPKQHIFKAGIKEHPTFPIPKYLHSMTGV